MGAGILFRHFLLKSMLFSLARAYFSAASLPKVCLASVVVPVVFHFSSPTGTFCRFRTCHFTLSPPSHVPPVASVHVISRFLLPHMSRQSLPYMSFHTFSSLTCTVRRFRTCHFSLFASHWYVLPLPYMSFLTFSLLTCTARRFRTCHFSLFASHRYVSPLLYLSFPASPLPQVRFASPVPVITQKTRSGTNTRRPSPDQKLGMF